MKQSEVLRKALTSLTEGGWKIIAVDSEPINSVDDAITEVNAVEMATVEFERERKRSWVLFVWQGPDEKYDEGEEIIADYDMRLDDIIGSLVFGEEAR